MSQDESRQPVARRSFLSQFGVGAAALGAAMATDVPVSAQAASAFQPARHTQDDWMDQVPGKHRFMFDTTTPTSAADARRYVSNFFTANKTGYGLESADLAVMIILRHNSTPFAFNDAMWGKYGARLSEGIVVADPGTNQAPTTNPANSSGVTLNSLIALGVHYAVCGMSTRRLAGVIARGTTNSPDSIFEELAKNLIGNAHMTAAGIVAVNRAQERGYTFAYVA